MGNSVGPQARREYLARMRERYETADKAAKSRLLDEVCEVTGYHRKAVIRLLRRAAVRRVRRRGRPVRYGPTVIGPLRQIWEAAGYPWSVGPAAGAAPGVAPVGDPALEDSAHRRRQAANDEPAADGPLPAAFQEGAAETAIRSDETGDAAQAPDSVEDGRWDVQVPGFTEIDLVAHSGDRADGDFLHSLNVTDIHTTWVETRAVLGKSQLHVQAALEHLRQQLPFRLRGIDSDNGSEFINNHLRRYCTAQQIQFTRGRPYKKDDNAHIEQKNWTHVRKLLGYVRYDSPAALAAINALYDDLRLLQNLYLPSVKLVEKRRVGARLRRRYEAPRTPLERVAACPDVDRETVHALQQLRDRLDPIALAARIDQQLQRIYRLANQRVSPALTPRRAAIDETGSAQPPARGGARRQPSLTNAADGTADTRPQAFNEHHSLTQLLAR